MTPKSPVISSARKVMDIGAPTMPVPSAVMPTTAMAAGSARAVKATSAVTSA
ncbi:MAG: hypothetical protein H6872_08800 [Methylobacteriaceae bacterium]|nr:hypothetical protein [Methylobacteriaceae bacterium]